MENRNPRRWLYSKRMFLFTGLASTKLYCYGQCVPSNNSKNIVFIIFKFRVKLKISLVALSLPVKITEVKIILIRSDMNIRRRRALPLCLVYPFRFALSSGCCKRIFSPISNTVKRSEHFDVYKMRLETLPCRRAPHRFAALGRPLLRQLCLAGESKRMLAGVQQRKGDKGFECQNVCRCDMSCSSICG